MFNYKLKKLIKYNSNKAGRNHQGSITVRHKSRGSKKLFFIKNKNIMFWNIPAILISFDFDFKTRTWLGLFSLHNGIVFYSILSRFLGIGSIIQNGFFGKYLFGNSFYLNDISPNSHIFNIQINSFLTLIKSPGSSGLFLNFSNFKGLISLPSKKYIYIHLATIVTLGIVLDSLYSFRSYKKAGYSRLNGIRPTVRGVAMNPVDHPHGGGEGKSSGGRPSVSIWGWLTK